LTGQAGDPRSESLVRGARFSVVVPAFNEEAVLAACLDSLAAQAYAGVIEVIVVDNASTDGTAALAREQGARVVHEPQPGICWARQRGLASATGEIVVTTDADTTVPTDWLQRIDDQFRNRPDAVAVAGPCVYVGGPWWSSIWARLVFALVATVAAVTGRVVYVTATNLAFYRASFGGYDTRLTQGGDELDVLRRLRQQGAVVFARSNVTFTSARRLTRGLLYSLVVSLCFDYLLGYFLNRVMRRPVVRTAPAFRPTEPERSSLGSGEHLERPTPPAHLGPDAFRVEQPFAAEAG
jgi:glycosyltransferase involved in cell wall biosynthesis